MKEKYKNNACTIRLDIISMICTVYAWIISVLYSLSYLYITYYDILYMIIYHVYGYILYFIILYMIILYMGFHYLHFTLRLMS